MKPKPFIALKNLTVPLAFSPVSWRCGPRSPEEPPLLRSTGSGAPPPGGGGGGRPRRTAAADRRDVNENIFAPVIANDETKSLLRIEEFDDAFAFADDLRRHSATAAAAE